MDIGADRKGHSWFVLLIRRIDTYNTFWGEFFEQEEPSLC